MRIIFILTLLLSISSCETIRSGQVIRTDHIIDAENDVRLHIREITPTDSKHHTPLVMIHGGGPGATASFDLPIKGSSFAQNLVDKGFKVYLVNIRGWERSTLPQYDFSDSLTIIGSHLEASQDIYATVKWILDKENIGKVHLFGWATGGHWAGYYSTKYPETVQTFISLNSLYGVNAPWGLRQYFQSDDDSTQFNKTSFFRESPQKSLTRSWTRTIPIDNKENWRDTRVEKAYSVNASSFGEDTTVMKVPGGYREESFYMSLGKKYWDAKDIEVPALIMRTELDFWSRPEDLKAIEKDMLHAPRSRFITIPGTHYVFLDKTDKGKRKLIEEMIIFMER
ncbi:alpha/beta hydrolase [Fulvivirga sp. M361]|uniref:alpha/beta fold hydrolase n=1 Tax=Fulvivirga sp. M361 TaxID=2594266 RepID=UPI001179FB2B|nr:alpha/beta fold hydrolase [Fulvivirga sp. M361]TRX59207.1 alpha/beta hydrolase [Fulvivirga sp. M361]